MLKTAFKNYIRKVKLSFENSYETNVTNVTPENTPSVPPTKLTRPNTPPLETQNETVEAKKTESPSRCPLGAKAKEITKSLLG